MVRFSEPERRVKYAKRYGIRVLFWFCAIVISFALVQFLVDPTSCQESQAVEWNTVCHNCQMENCIDCSSAGKHGCDEFKEGYFFDSVTGKVMSKTCLLDHCKDCSKSGIRGCDLCDENYRYNELLGFCQSMVCKDVFCD